MFFYVSCGVMVGITLAKFTLNTVYSKVKSICLLKILKTL